MQPKTKRRIRLLLKIVVVTLVIATLAGFVYEEIGRRNDRKRIPQIGQSIDIGGRTLNIYCSGEGSPTVILDSGAGEPGYAWSNIQPEIAKFTRACWYDRAGEGWSDLGPFPRTSATNAQDLHELLRRAGVSSPYILVGHSYGGLNARVYNGMYPNEVAGMVLVDSAHEEEPNRAPKFMLGKTLPKSLWYPLHLVTRAALRVGLIRLFTSSPSLPADPAQQTRRQIVAALRQQPKAVATLSDYVTSPESYAQAHAAAGLGDKPLIVLTRGKPLSPSGNAEMDREATAYEQVWMHELQAQLVRLSTRGRQVIVSNSGHGIPEEAPQAVIDAVREVVMMSRATRR
ncbi:MAG TPA: alpha/beta hydrolase [Pyrinomonadaceae bacterium]|nr:alpha/beta hydrolase [Pyrinomonadaceae bacterium]